MPSFKYPPCGIGFVSGLGGVEGGRPSFLFLAMGCGGKRIWSVRVARGIVRERFFLRVALENFPRKQMVGQATFCRKRAKNAVCFGKNGHNDGVDRPKFDRFGIDGVL